MKVTKGKYDKLTIHEVADSELDAIVEAAERDPLGSTSILLNFAIALLSMSGSFLLTLVTTRIDSDRLYASLLAVTFTACVGGILLLALWGVFYSRGKRSRRTIFEIVQKIRDRLPASEGIPEPFPPQDSPSRPEPA